MGTIHVHEFTSLDGVVDAPVWSAGYAFLPRMAEIVGGLTDRATALLLGRRTHEMFEPGWSNRTAEDDPAAPFFNDATKYVVSSTMKDPTWRNTEVIGGYVPDRIRQLKEQTEGALYVSGSATLVRALLADGLVDELHLFVYPLTRGIEGPRLFPAGPLDMELRSCEAFEHGVVYLNYAPKSREVA